MLHCEMHCLNTKINHVPTSHSDKDCLNHGQIWLIMVNHDRYAWSHCDKNHLLVQCHIVTTMVIHGQPWSNIALWHRLSQYADQPWSTMVNHFPTSHCDKCCINVKINHGQPYPNVAWQIFILGFIFLGFIIFISWV